MNEIPKNAIRTFSGKWMNIFEATEDMICIEDIAHALSNQCRFGGHLPRYYSVAQHSLMCSELATPDKKLEALLHDASEAYLLDIPRPIKGRLTNYKEIENNLMSLIANKYGFQYPLSKEIKQIDQQSLQLEWDQIMMGKKVEDGIIPFSPEYAKEMFLKAFYDLTEQKH